MRVYVDPETREVLDRPCGYPLSSDDEGRQFLTTLGPFQPLAATHQSTLRLAHLAADGVVTQDTAASALLDATHLLNSGAYAEVGHILAFLREDPATAAKGPQFDIAEQLLLECVRLEAQWEEHEIAAEQARRRRDVLRDEVASILQLSVGAARTRTVAGDPSDGSGFGERTTSRASPSSQDHEIHLAVHLLGEFEVFLDDQPIARWYGHRPKAVLQLLVLAAPRTVGVDAMIDALWPESDSDAGRRNLHQAVYMLRKSLRGLSPGIGEVVRFERPDYRLSPTVDLWSDVAEFERSVASGRRAASHNLTDGLRDLETAIGLYRGEFLEGSLYDEWTFNHRDRLRREFNDAAMTLFEIYGQLRRFDTLIDLAHRAVGFDPCNEIAHRHLIAAYDAQGKRHLAIRQFDTCSRELARNLGVEPAPETKRLLRRIRSDH